MYEIAIFRRFLAAHAIRLYDGSLEPVHSHVWSVEITVSAERLDKIEVAMDFHILENALDELLICFRNRTLNDVAPFAGGQVNPTAERVAWWIGTQISSHLPESVSLQRTVVGEAPGCSATFLPVE